MPALQSLQSLRKARWITGFVLVWFALLLGAAVASPLVQADSTQMVCSAMGGMKLVNVDADPDSPPTASLGMECPLCMPSVAPPPPAWVTPHPGGLAHALHPLESARLTRLIGPPWQARGPPFLSL